VINHRRIAISLPGESYGLREGLSAKRRAIRKGHCEMPPILGVEVYGDI
jgi:hypothetical protein